MKRLFFTIALIATPFFASAQVVSESDIAKAKDLVSKMTLEEKVDYIGGFNQFYIRPIERLGIPEIKMADGPQGVRNNTKSTLYPSGIAAAATWNKALVREMGVGLGQDSRARGVHILLGPGVNIYRSPLCGRNFEYFGEDPYLSSETAVNYIEGVQSQGVMACVKHFAANNQEWARHTTSSDVDERTLSEIYFPAFEKAVKKAHVGAVMDSYNLINSVHSTENKWLNIQILRDLWGFQGILMSDWTATYSPLNAATNGLDLEMPNAKAMTPQAIIPLIKRGIIDEREIDLKVQHILQTLIAFGFFDRAQLDKSIGENNPYSDQVSLEMARNGVVMLKNDDNFLPVTKGKVVVCGPHSDMIVTGGGSGFVTPLVSTSVSAGMQQMGKKIKASSCVNAMLFSLANCSVDKSGFEKGAKAEYFNNKNLSGAPFATETVSEINFNYGANAPKEGMKTDGFSIRFSFWYTPATDSRKVIEASGDDGYRLFIDGDEIFNDWSNHSFRSKSDVIEFKAGHSYQFVMEYYDNASDARVAFSYSGLLDTPGDIAAIKSADAVVLCVGFDSTTERENSDRTFELPFAQQAYIEAVSKLNSNVVVVLNGGGGIEMASWMDKVKAVLMAWYPGQQGGLAVSEIITGKISPSGKLPISIEKEAQYNPSFDNYYENVSNIRSINPYTRVQYNEGIFVGYRGYEMFKNKPLFEFGFGLSYTTFEYSDIQAVKTATGFDISFNVKNTGKFDAAEVAELYVGDVECSCVRPIKELKGYDKVFLKIGESKRITISLDDEAFRFYDLFEHRFKVEPGDFDIYVGASSSDIRLKTRITL